jgi:hypothetical protein
MQQGDLIRLTDVQFLEGYPDEILNVYYYHVFTMTAEAPLPVYMLDLATAFIAQVIIPVSYLQVTALTHVRLDAMNMSNQLEIGSYTYDEPYAGDVVGDYAPSNVTYSFRLVRYDRSTRNGRKSLSGVPDEAIIAGRTLNPSFAAGVSNAAEAIGSTINVEGDSSDATLVPSIVRIPANPNVVPTVFNTVIQAAFIGFGTQNSRKSL